MEWLGGLLWFDGLMVVVGLAPPRSLGLENCEIFHGTLDDFAQTQQVRRSGLGSKTDLYRHPAGDVLYKSPTNIIRFTKEIQEPLLFFGAFLKTYHTSPTEVLSRGRTSIWLWAFTPAACWPMPSWRSARAAGARSAWCPAAMARPAWEGRQRKSTGRFKEQLVFFWCL